jgi:hypothetical protein
MNRFLCFLVASVCFLSSNLLSQSISATVSGGVMDPTGSFIQGAEINIANDTTGVLYTVTTNDSGIYVAPVLPPGHYHVQVSKLGFKTIIKPDVILNVQSALVLNFTLPVGASSESVTVEAGSSLINTVDASVSTVIDRKFVANIPLNGRSFQDLISMTPGVVTQSPQSQSSIGGSGDFSVNGQRTESNYYTVDGVSANSGVGSGAGFPTPGTGGTLSSSTALGTTQSLISVDALQEFRVQSSTYSAVYGRSPGGQFSLATRSGTKKFHGSVFDYLRNNYFDANNWFNDLYGTPASALRQNDFGGTFGGPVLPFLHRVRDSTFFFVSYEGLRLTQPQAASVQYVPDLAMRQQAASVLQPILNAFPLPTPGGIDYGTPTNPSLAQFIQGYALPARIDSTSIRLDQMFGARHHIFFRFGDTPSFTESRSLFAVARQQVNSKTYTLGFTSQLPGNTANELRFGYSDNESTNSSKLDEFGGASPINLPSAMGIAIGNPEAIFILFVPGVGEPILQTLDARLGGSQWNLVDTVSRSIAKHHLTLGIDYRHLRSQLTPVTPEGEVVYLSSQSVVNNTADTAIVFNNVASTPIFNETAFFGQDEWKLAPQLNLSLGIRWEVNPPPTEASGNDAFTVTGNINNPSSLALAPRGTPLWKTSWYNFAPRLGIAWQPYRTRPGWETVLRTGGGVFFDTDNQLAASGYDAIGFSAHNTFSKKALPFLAPDLVSPPSLTPPYTSNVVAFPEHLQLPYTLEWNVSLQQAFGSSQAITVSYVGSNARRLIQQESRSIKALNPNFSNITFLQSGVTSNYQALQLTFQRTVAHGIQALASYTWSHSIDFGSSASALPAIRGNSDFDVRNNLQAGISWDLPQQTHRGKLISVLLNDWGIDLRAIARTAFPVTLAGNLLTDPATGNQYYSGVNLALGQPIYLYGKQCPNLPGSACPGGRVINKAAFAAPPGTSVGNAPRNFIRGFGATQANLAVRRTFPLHDSLNLQFRAETFNGLNHPNFGYINPVLSNAQFGQATQMLNQSLGTMSSQYQQGGPRSMQFELRLSF